MAKMLRKRGDSELGSKEPTIMNIVLLWNRRKANSRQASNDLGLLVPVQQQSVHGRANQTSSPKWKRKLIPFGTSEMLQRRLVKVSTKSSRVQYLYSEEDDDEIQALGPAGEGQVAKLEDLKLIDDDAQ
ncbi:hypothetical protein JOM56_007527 [Amanita muscaria]